MFSIMKLFSGELKQHAPTPHCSVSNPSVPRNGRVQGKEQKFSTNVPPSSPLLPAFHSQGGAACTRAQMYKNAHACVSETAQKDIQNSEVQLIF